jgi:hypothetical protein
MSTRIDNHWKPMIYKIKKNPTGFLLLCNNMHRLFIFSRRPFRSRRRKRQPLEYR